jgi:hypothetical protein
MKRKKGPCSVIELDPDGFAHSQVDDSDTEESKYHNEQNKIKNN